MYMKCYPPFFAENAPVPSRSAVLHRPKSLPVRAAYIVTIPRLYQSMGLFIWTFLTRFQDGGTEPSRCGADSSKRFDTAEVTSVTLSDDASTACEGACEQIAPGALENLPESPLPYRWEFTRRHPTAVIQPRRVLNKH
jgi:hypothetical protein